MNIKATTAALGITLLICFPLQSGEQDGGIVRTFEIPPVSVLTVSSSTIYWTFSDLMVGNSARQIARLDSSWSQQFWQPAFSAGWRFIALSPGPEARLWAAFSRSASGARSEMLIGSIEYGRNTFREYWKSDDLFFQKFAVSKSDTICGIGYKRGVGDILRNPGNLVSVTAELLHVVDIRTGSQVHLLPVSVPTGFEGYQRILSVLSGASISMRPNGNFFVNFPPVLLKSYGWSDLLAAQAIEYCPDGRICRVWDLTSSEDATVFGVFADGDEAVIAQILVGEDRRRNIGGETRVGITMREQSLVRADGRGGLARFDGILQPWEVVIGWMAGRRQIVTEDFRNHTTIRVRKVPF